MNPNTTPYQEALGSALNDTRAAEKAAGLDTSDFESETDKAILSAIKSLSADRQPITLITVDTATGGQYTAYLVTITAAAYMPSLIDTYISAIKDKSKRRKIKAAASELYNAAQDSDKSLDELTAEFAHRIDALAEIDGGTVSAWDAVFALINEIDKKDDNKGVIGIPLLDQALGGMSGGRLYVVGARPATGKTALAISAAFNTAAYGDVLFCSYEMQPSEIMGRILARLSKVNSQDISYRTLTNEQIERLGGYYATAGNLPIKFGINCSTPERVRAEALRMQKKLKLIVIDYLQLMSSGRKAESRRVEVGQISRALKQLSIELNVPVLALSQLNRASEEKASRAPTMSEMRESGDIEQDADAIVLMYQLPEDDAFSVVCETAGHKPVRILLDKNRQGKSGLAIDTAFDGNTMTFISKSAVMEAGK
jgi:replicative DNA helicase